MAESTPVVDSHVSISDTDGRSGLDVIPPIGGEKGKVFVKFQAYGRGTFVSQSLKCMHVQSFFLAEDVPQGSVEKELIKKESGRKNVYGF